MMFTGQINSNAAILYYNASTIGANNNNTQLISNCPAGLVLTTNGLTNSPNYTNQFQNNSVLQWVQVTGTNSNMTISTNMFSNCASLNYIGTGQGIEDSEDNTNWFTTPSLNFPITGIGQSAFYRCTALTQLNINSSLNSINNSAFQSCTDLTYVSLPSPNQGYIGTSAFYGCSKLSLVNIPKILGSYINNIFRFHYNIYYNK